MGKRLHEAAPGADPLGLEDLPEHLQPAKDHHHGLHHTHVSEGRHLSGLLSVECTFPWVQQGNPSQALLMWDPEQICLWWPRGASGHGEFWGLADSCTGYGNIPSPAA